MVVIDVYLRTGKDIAVAQPEQEPGIDLHAAVTVLAGAVAAYVVSVGLIAESVEVLFRILVAEFTEDAETVAFKEKLRLGEEVDTSFEHEGDGHGNDSTQLYAVTRIDTECHQGASTKHGTEVGCIAGTAQNIVM